MTEAQKSFQNCDRLFGLTGPLIKSSQGDKGAFVTAMEFEMTEGLTQVFQVLTVPLKPTLIDLEARKRVTRGKRKQPERLSERARKGCDSLNNGITKEAVERNPKRFLH